MKKAILFLFTITLSILLAACSNGDKGDDSDKNLESVDKDKIKVVTSFSMIEI